MFPALPQNRIKFRDLVHISTFRCVALRYLALPPRYVMSPPRYVTLPPHQVTSPPREARRT